MLTTSKETNEDLEKRWISLTRNTLQLSEYVLKMEQLSRIYILYIDHKLRYITIFFLQYFTNNSV